LFYGATEKDKQFTAGSIRKIIDDSISELNLNPLLKSKSFRHTYMKHMTELGVPLIKVLIDLELNAFDTHLKYSKIIHGVSEIMFSPIEVVLSFNLDRKEGLRTFVSLNGNPQPNVLCTRQR